jgi:hypothetical protein
MLRVAVFDGLERFVNVASKPEEVVIERSPGRLIVFAFPASEALAAMAAMTKNSLFIFSPPIGPGRIATLVRSSDDYRCPRG